MIFTSTASIMYWSMQNPGGESDPSNIEATTPDASPVASMQEEETSVANDIEKLSIDEATSDSAASSHVGNGGTLIEQ